MNTSRKTVLCCTMSPLANVQATCSSLPSRPWSSGV